MRILNSMKLHSNNADAGLMLELVDDGGGPSGHVRFVLSVASGPGSTGSEAGAPIDATTAVAVMEMSRRTEANPDPVRGRKP